MVGVKVRGIGSPYSLQATFKPIKNPVLCKICWGTKFYIQNKRFQEVKDQKEFCCLYSVGWHFSCKQYFVWGQIIPHGHSSLKVVNDM